MDKKLKQEINKLFADIYDISFLEKLEKYVDALYLKWEKTQDMSHDDCIFLQEIVFLKKVMPRGKK